MSVRAFIPSLLVLVASACTSGAADTLAPASAPLTPAMSAAIATALQDEYHAEQTYRGVLTSFGNAMPFANIITAEQRHAAALASLLEVRGIAVPASIWNAGNVPQFSTLATACAVAADAEVANIALYDELLTQDLPTDVRTVFTNNRRASLEGHLPAFTRCR
jgi:hypothetical protein